MEISLEKLLMGILIGILLFCIGKNNKIIEGLFDCNRKCEPSECASFGNKCPIDGSARYVSLETGGCSSNVLDFSNARSGCCDMKDCHGGSPPSPPSPPPPSPPAPPSHPTPPAPGPTDEICSNLTTDPNACLQDDGVPYGCAAINSSSYDNVKKGYVWFCNKTKTDREGCDRLPEDEFKWCPSKNEPAPEPPPPPPSPCTSPISPPDDFPGYIQINNITDKTITLWYDTKTGGGKKMKQTDNEGNVRFNEGCVTRVEPNGYRMTPNSSLFIKFIRGDEWESFGMWATYNDIRGREVTGSRAAPNVQRILELTKVLRMPRNIFFNNSYVDGFNGTNSYIVYKNKKKDKILINRSQPCNLKYINNKETCESIGGRCMKQTTVAEGSSRDQQVWTCTNPKFWANEKLGLEPGAMAGTGCPEAGGRNTCDCLETWYNNYKGPNTKYDWPTCTNEKGEQEKCPRLWYRSLREKCPSSYSWAFQEKDPININDSKYLQYTEWCPGNFEGNNQKLQESLERTDENPDGFFQVSPALETAVMGDDDESPVIIVDIEYIWDPQDCDETWRN